MLVSMFETAFDPISLGCLIVAVMTLIVFTGYASFGDSDNDKSLYMSNLFILAIIIAVSGSIAMVKPMEVTNIAEIQSIIHQEYGISITDQTVQSMYESIRSGERGPWFAEDTSGMVHEYTIVNDKIIFIQSQEG